MDDRAEARAAEWDGAQLLIRFFNAFDAFRYDDMVALFAAYGVWHRQGKALTGRDAILAELRTRPTTQTVRHIVTNIEITLEDRDQARFLLYLTAYRADPGTPLPVTIAAPTMLLTVPGALVRDGAIWRIASMTMDRTFLFA